MPTITRIGELTERAGTELGASEWVDVTQETVDAFAAAAGDHQWIHTDPARAADSPFGGTIAHGYYTLALAPALLADVLPLDGFAMVVNYGLDRLRFPAPLPTAERLRMRVGLDAVEPVEGGAALSLTFTFERASGGKPVCVANVIYRVYEER
jgi:acyl dehydratase